MSNLYVMRDYNGVEGLNKLLNDFFHNQNDLVMAEIGSFSGESASIFINSNHFKTLYCIDPWKLGYDERDEASFQAIEAERVFDEKFKNEPRIVKIKKMSNEAYKDIPDESLDFIYIDGCHKYENVLEDLTNFYPKIKKGGFISGHDLSDCWYGVIQAVMEYFKRQPITVYQDSSWIYRK